jgi:hypothetical protein
MKVPTSADLTKLKRAYLLGLAKESVPPGESSLATLSLVAMRSMYARPAPMSAPHVDILEPDSRPVLPEPTRDLVLTLCGGKAGSANDQIGLAVARALRAAGVRLHPFDFARLHDFVVRYAAELGPTAKSWAAYLQPSSKESVADAYVELITEESIGSASRAAKIAFLTNLRHSSPARARAIIERIAPSEPANVRAELAGLLRIGLSDDDIPCLQSFITDRAQSVRDRASALLGRFPGTEQHEKNVALFRDHLKVTGTGILRRRKTLTVTSADKKLDAISTVFANSRLEDMARAIDLSVEEFAEAAAESEGIDALALASAINERRLNLIPKFADALKRDNGQVALALVAEALPKAQRGDRVPILSACLRPETWAALPNKSALEAFYVTCGEALPADVARRLLDSRAWSAVVNQGANASRPDLTALADAVAPLIPRELAGAFITATETVSNRASHYHRLLLALPDQGKHHGAI